MAENLITSEDLFRLDTGGDRIEPWDGRLRQRDHPYEFLDTAKVLRGEILVNPPPGARHGHIQLRPGSHPGHHGSLESLEDSRIPSEGDVLHGTDLVPGWRLPLRELFR